VSFYKQKKPKRFNYTSRFDKDSKIPEKEDLGTQWDDIRRSRKLSKGRMLTLPKLLVFLVLVLILLYVLRQYEI